MCHLHPTEGRRSKQAHTELHQAHRTRYHTATQSITAHLHGSVPASCRRVPPLGAPKRHHALRARDLYLTPGRPDTGEAMHSIQAWPRARPRFHSHWAHSQALLSDMYTLKRMGALPSMNGPKARGRGHNMSGVWAQHIHGAKLGERPTWSTEQFTTSTTL